MKLYAATCAGLLWMATAFVQVAAGLPVPQTQEPAAELRPACASPGYLPVPQPDAIADVLKARKRYRLVIGAGEYLDHPETNNRTYVAPTAALIDTRLAELGYQALPGVNQSGKPYLVGKSANRTAITAALQELASATQGPDFGVVYYVGHGSISAGGSDLSLGIYEEPVASDQGYRVTDLLGKLQTGIYRSSIAEIPHLFVILDACFSGTVAPPSTVIVQTVGGVQHLAEISGGGPVIPDQVAILTATAPGASSNAYELRGTGLSAFGYYFARALKEDWACSDSLSRDGILTLLEMKEYLKARLQLATQKGAVDAAMSPTMLARDQNALLAYRSDKYFEPGFRDFIYSLIVRPATNQIADVLLPGGALTTCSDSTNGCAVPISKAYLNSKVTLAVLNKRGGYSSTLGDGGVPELPQETIKIADLLTGTKTVLGVSLTVK
jgi:hypothetical protein